MFPDRLVVCFSPARRTVNMPFHEQHLRVAPSRLSSADAKVLTTSKVVRPSSHGSSRTHDNAGTLRIAQARGAVAMSNSGTVSRGVLR